jgi:hypothetical protein
MTDVIRTAEANDVRTPGQSRNLVCNKCGQEGCYCKHSMGDLASMLSTMLNRNDSNVVATISEGSARNE